MPALSRPTRRFWLFAPVSVVAVALLQAGPARAQYVVQQDVPPPPPHRTVWSPERLQLTAQAGYLFGAEVSTSQGNVGFDGDVTYGAAIDYRLPAGFLFEGSYAFLSSDLELRNVAASRKLADMDVHYIQLGLQKELAPGMARPYVSFTGGVTDFAVGGPYDDEWRFAAALGAGVKLLPNPRIGVRLQGRLVSSFVGEGSSVFCGFGGCSFGFVGSSILQTELTAGLFVAL